MITVSFVSVASISPSPVYIEYRHNTKECQQYKNLTPGCALSSTLGLGVLYINAVQHFMCEGPHFTHMHESIISLRREFGFIKLGYPVTFHRACNNLGSYAVVYMCVWDIDLVSSLSQDTVREGMSVSSNLVRVHSTIFLLEFGTVPTVCFFFYILLHQHQW